MYIALVFRGKSITNNGGNNVGKETIHEMRARHERTRDAGVSIARQVSTLLRKAGFDKSGGYHAYEYRAPGYQVMESGNGTNVKPTAVVMWCNSNHAAIHEGWLMSEVTADGRFEVNGNYVTRKTTEATP
jgi:hypothetical protein